MLLQIPERALFDQLALGLCRSARSLLSLFVTLQCIFLFTRGVHRSRIGPDRTGPAWTEDRIEGRGRTEDRIGP